MKKGYSTLIGMLFLLAFASTMIAGLSVISLSGLKSQLLKQDSAKASLALLSCEEEVLRRLKDQISYSGGVVSISDGGSCDVQLSSSATPDVKTLVITARRGSGSRSLRAEISVLAQGSSVNLRILRWEE